MDECDWLLDITLNGRWHKALSQEEECLREYRVRAYWRGYNYGHTGGVQYRIKDYFEEANGLYDAYNRGYQVGLAGRNLEWMHRENDITRPS